MKVVCIKDDYTTFDPISTYKSRTTIGKTYELLKLKSLLGNNDEVYYFIDDFGDKPIYNEKYFVTLEQWREQKINQILENEN